MAKIIDISKVKPYQVFSFQGRIAEYVMLPPYNGNYRYSPVGEYYASALTKPLETKSKVFIRKP